MSRSRWGLRPATRATMRPRSRTRPTSTPPSPGWRRARPSSWQGSSRRDRPVRGSLRRTIGHRPGQNRLHGGEPRVVGLSNDREQLKPQIIVGAFEKLANRTRHEVRNRHGRGRCATVDLSRDIGMQRRHDAVRDIGTIKLRDQFSKHGAPTFSMAGICRARRQRFIEREVSPFRRGRHPEYRPVLPER